MFRLAGLTGALFLLGASAGSLAQTAPAEPDWPTATPGTILSTPDWSDYRIYPTAARRKNQEGRVVAAILVGADGRPTMCRIVETSGYAELDAGTCDLMLQLRFEPARDAEGRAVPSAFKRRINWLLGDPRDFASSSVVAQVTGLPDGKAQCRIVRAEGAYQTFWSLIACQLFSNTYYMGDAPVPGRSVLVAARLDAGDGVALPDPWPAGAGTPIAQETVTFKINDKGDATECVAHDSHGFGQRGLNNLSPCGRLVSSLWIKNATGKTGTMETRVYPAGDIAVE